MSHQVFRFEGHTKDAEIRWFRNLASVPGSSYATPPGLDRAALPGYDSIPQLSEYEFDDQTRRSLRWPMSNGGVTSTSPAQQRAYENRKEETARDRLRRLQEALELPGTVADYHFAIQHAAETIYQGRRGDSALVEEAERLWWLDVELIEAHPYAVEHRSGEFYWIASYDYLVRLYEGEGYLHEALKIAERGIGAGQDNLSAAVERLRANLAELEAEEAEV